MYPTNLHGSSVYAPKPIYGAIKNEVAPTKNSLGSFLGTQKTQHMQKRETVWQLHLETALLEGLRQFQPTVCKETVMLGRYPGRNQFLSQYILNKTGQQRTVKQVASRLQQLRDSCPGQELWDLLFPSPYSSIQFGSAATSQRRVSEVPPLVIIIDIVPEGAPIQPYESTPQPWSEKKNVIHASRHPRRLSCIDPTVTFAAHSPIEAQSWFTVFTNDGPVHIESGPLTVIHLPNPGGFLHGAVLVPSFWKTIVESPDPTCYTISHQVIKLDDCAVVFSATYTFRYSWECPPWGNPEAISTISLGNIWAAGG